MTRDAAGSDRERLLDRCIDALLAGRSWREELLGCSARTAELEPLMRVAEDFLEATRRLPPPAPGRRFEVWRRLSEAAADPFRFRARAFAFAMQERGKAVLSALAAALLG